MLADVTFHLSDLFILGAVICFVVVAVLSEKIGRLIPAGLALFAASFFSFIKSK